MHGSAAHTKAPRWAGASGRRSHSRRPSFPGVPRHRVRQRSSSQARRGAAGSVGSAPAPIFGQSPHEIPRNLPSATYVNPSDILLVRRELRSSFVNTAPSFPDCFIKNSSFLATAPCQSSESTICPLCRMLCKRPCSHESHGVPSRHSVSAVESHGVLAIARPPPPGYILRIVAITNPRSSHHDSCICPCGNQARVP